MSQDEQPISYFDNRFRKEAVKLLPGQYVATASNKVLVTILGSCVAACIYDPEKKIGGMNHFMLPELNLASELDSNLASKYGVHAMDMLIEKLITLGARKESWWLKLLAAAKCLLGLCNKILAELTLSLLLTI